MGHVDFMLVAHEGLKAVWILRWMRSFQIGRQGLIFWFFSFVKDDVGILLDAISLGQIIISPLFSESFFHCLHRELTSDGGQDVGPLVSIEAASIQKKEACQKVRQEVLNVSLPAGWRLELLAPPALPVSFLPLICAPVLPSLSLPRLV